MEADWEAEIGPGLNWIDADWPGLVDLRREPKKIHAVNEAEQYPALREALTALNAPGSPVFTCKCDVWPLAAEEIDPWEFGLAPGQSYVGLASYVDLIVRDPVCFCSFARQESLARRWVQQLQEGHGANGRVDLVVRRANAAGIDGYGITLYASGCGIDADAARHAWETILRAAVTVTMSEAAPPGASSSIG